MSKPTLLKFRRRAAFVGAATLSTLLIANAAFADSQKPASIIAFNQKSANGAVSLTYAYLPRNGAVDVYAVGPDGKLAGKSLGNVTLKAGDYRNVRVMLNPLPAKGTRLVAVIEKDKPINSSGNRPERTFSIL